MRVSAEDRDGRGLKLALLIEEGSGEWHARRLKAAMEKRGAAVVVSSLPLCAFDTRHPCGIEIPEFGDRLPDGVFVRSISAGTLEQITFRLGLLHGLRESGVRVWNDARAIERCVDKSQTTFLLHKAGIATPRTRTVEGEAPARIHAETATAPLVIKPLFGSQGKGLGRIDRASDLPSPELVDSIYYLQDFVPPRGENFEDWRVLVTRNRVVAAMTRRAGQWITNVHQGGDPVPHVPDPEMARLALGALRAIDGDYAGIDLIRAPSGELMVLEVNSNPAWRGLQSVAEIDIAQAITDDFLSAVLARQRQTA